MKFIVVDMSKIENRSDAMEIGVSIANSLTKDGYTHITWWDLPFGEDAELGNTFAIFSDNQYELTHADAYSLVNAVYGTGDVQSVRLQDYSVSVILYQ